MSSLASLQQSNTLLGVGAPSVKVLHTPTAVFLGKALLISPLSWQGRRVSIKLLAACKPVALRKSGAASAGSKLHAST